MERKEEEERLAKRKEEKRVLAIAKRAARLEKERLQKEQEIEEKQHFAELRIKYRIEGAKEVEPISPLFQILLQLEEKKQLSKEEISWLESNEYYLFIANYCVWWHQYSGDDWDLLNAGKHFRKAKQPERVNEIYKSINSENNKLLSAILTNQGGAYRDLRDLENAEKCARSAMNLCPNSYFPYNLLGAVYYQRGDPTTGDINFQMAIELGATPISQDAQIRNAIQDSENETKGKVAQYLLKKDPERYQWAKFYLNQ